MKTLSGTILVADDDADIRDILKDTLSSLGVRIVTAANGQDCLDRVEADAPDVLLLDIEMPVKSGLQVLQELRERGSEVTVIMITAYGTIERAVQAIKQGAYDFITKPFDLDHIVLTLEKALERQRLKRGFEQFSEELGQRYQLIGGESPKMREAIETAKKTASSRSTVLLLGESGTGKEVFARAIHEWSERRSEPFIAINCVGLAKDLLESELFGHEKGAFTGAHQLKKASLSLLIMVPCFSTKSAISRRSCRLSCCAFCRNGSSSASAGRRRFASMFVSSPRRTATCRAQSKRDAFARTFSTGST